MLLYCDGFDTYATADIPKRWNLSGSSSASAAINSSYGRFSTSGMKFLSGLNNVMQIDRVLNGNKTTLIAGLAVSIIAYPQSGSLYPIVTFTDGGVIQVGLAVNSAGALVFFKATGGTFTTATQISATSTTLSTGVFNYIELQASPGTSIAANTCFAHVNGALVGSVAAATNIAYSGNAWANSVTIGNTVTMSNGFGGMYFDDVYICDNTGTTNNVMLGDVRVETLRPTGAGSNTGFTPSTGANYSCVNETTEDGDTTYVASNIVGTTDTYAIGSLATTPNAIMGVQVNITARKDDAGYSAVTSAIESSNSLYDHGTVAKLPLSTSYLTFSDTWESDPVTSAAWTVAGLNAAQIGARLAS